MKREAEGERLPWRETGVWLAGDTHAHYRLVGFEALVSEARRHCDFLVLASHGHIAEAFGPQPGLIEEARARHPDLLLVNGVQWEAPIGDSVTVLMPGVSQGMPIFEEFLKRFDTRVGGAEETDENFLEALRFLGGKPIDGVLPAVILQHPHGARTFTVEQIRSALEVGAALVGFCITSGQRWREGREGDIHPWAAEVGGVADTLFAERRRVLMTAESDFHQRQIEGRTAFWPGEFRKTYVFCPQRSEAGLFAGLRSGAYYLVVGGIVEGLELTASARGESVMMGERLTVAAGATVEVRVEFAARSAVAGVELIGNPTGEAAVVARVQGKELERRDETLRWKTEVKAPPTGTFFLRVRGAAPLDEPPGSVGCFYSAPLWVVVS